MKKKLLKTFDSKVPFRFLIAAVFVCILAGAALVALFFNAPAGIAVDGAAPIISETELKSNAELFLNNNSEAIFGQKFDFVVSDANLLSNGFMFVTFDAFSGSEAVGQLSVYTDGSYVGFANSPPLDMSASIPVPEPVEEPIVDVAKSDKPVVELFVMSYCPFGTQAEKGILPVVNLLGDKIDFKIRFVYYAMHGKTEVDEQTKQYCIQKGQPEKYVGYLSCFLKEGNTSACIAETGVDEGAMNACVALADEEFQITANLNDQASWLSGAYPLFDVDKELNEMYGVGGSPTLVVNGMTVSSARNSASLLETICSTFNTAPEECSEQLSSETPSSGFGFDTTAASATTAGCGA